MKEYQYRYTTVCAIVFDGNIESPELCAMMGARIVQLGWVCQDVAVLCTKQGPVSVDLGDYIVRLPNGEFRAYKPQEFAKEFVDIPAQACYIAG